MQEMTAEEKTKLTDLKKCDFSEMSDYFKAQSEARKAMTKEEKLVSCFGNYFKTKSDFGCIFIYFLLIDLFNWCWVTQYNKERTF